MVRSSTIFAYDDTKKRLRELAQKDESFDFVINILIDAYRFSYKIWGVDLNHFRTDREKARYGKR